MSPVSGWRGRLASTWQGLAPREKRLVGAAAVVVVLGLLWSVALQPAWRTVARAPAEIDRLDAELQAMQRLGAEAQTLRAAPSVPLDQAHAALKAASERLGERAQITLSGERVLVRFNGIAPSALRDWLAEARAGARARPVAAALQRGGEGFSGTLELALDGGAR